MVDKQSRLPVSELSGWLESCVYDHLSEPITADRLHSFITIDSKCFLKFKRYNEAPNRLGLTINDLEQAEIYGHKILSAA